MANIARMWCEEGKMPIGEVAHVASITGDTWKTSDSKLLASISKRLSEEKPVLERAALVDLFSTFSKSEVTHAELAAQLAAQFASSRHHTPRQLASLAVSLARYGDRYSHLMKTLSLFLHRHDIRGALKSSEVATIMLSLGRASCRDSYLIHHYYTKKMGLTMNGAQLAKMLEGLVLMGGRDAAPSSDLRRFCRGVEASFIKGRVTGPTLNVDDLLVLSRCIVDLPIHPKVYQNIVAAGYSLFHHISPLEAATIASNCSRARYTLDSFHQHCYEDHIKNHLDDPAVNEQYTMWKKLPAESIVTNMIDLVPRK
eukprot:TRINITY_DN19359_c0_g1_i1.p1 TRINITY_DN19359_c0_g1~~TRINITY_DN19359_c0_g1_i1.p1  ORF type:complete len:312 (+),score=31.92 TRINITY_DN19359_c0_g1_i1:476-1411(+)